MPAPKKMTPVEPTQQRSESDLDFAHAEGMTDHEVEEFRIEAFNLLARVGALIRTMNANGTRSDKFCRLCSQARLMKVPCVHSDVWKLER